MSGSADGTVRVWNPKSSKASAVFEGAQFHEGGVNCLALAQDAPLVLSGSEDMTAKLMHMEAHKILLTFGDHTESVENVAFCPVYVAVQSQIVLSGKCGVADDSDELRWVQAAAGGDGMRGRQASHFRCQLGSAASLVSARCTFLFLQ